MKINPRVDFAFKKLFGVEKNKDLLLSLINSIVSEKDQVKDLILQNPYNTQDFVNDKTSILDIKALNEKTGVWFNIEMQIGYDMSFDKRAMYYWSKLFASQLESGTAYFRLKKTISINFLNFNLIKSKTDSYHSVYRILNTATKEDNLNDIFELHFIELKKFKKDFPDLVSALDRWASFLNLVESLDKNKLPKKLDSKVFKKASEEVLILFDEAERKRYEDRLHFHMNENSRFLEAEELGERKGIKKGVIKGRKEGEKEGIKKGKEEGRKEGIKEEKLKIAKNLKENGLDISVIISVTGLNKEEIEKI